MEEFDDPVDRSTLGHCANVDGMKKPKPEHVQPEDMFKTSFKKFKQSPASSAKAFQDVVFDGSSLPEASEAFQYEIISPLRVQTWNLPDSHSDHQQEHENVHDSRHSRTSCPCQEPFPGLRPFPEWEVIKFKFPEGLIFIKNPFTSCGQRYWISKCINNYPFTEGHITNVTNLTMKRTGTGEKPNTEIGESDLYRKLRWVTFGYHHNWDTKIYSEEAKCEFPIDLAELTKYLSLVLGFKDFKAEAAIVNYYNMDSTLSGHQDRSEDFQEAPLFSISFGQSAIFLIGGESKEVETLPIYLRSGDIVVMSGRSRKSYHAVPKILPTFGSSPWSLTEDGNGVSDTTATAKAGDSRGVVIGQEVSESDEPSAKRIKEMSSSSATNCDCIICSSMSGNGKDLTFSNKVQFSSVIEKWDVGNFLNAYISQHRINLNVRQVLFLGQSSLRNKIEETC